MKAWSIKDLALSLNAVPLDGPGYGDDEVLTIAWEADAFEVFKGADGEVSRSETNDDSAVATLRLAQTSDVNDRLTGLYQADRLLRNGAGAGVFMARDTEGRMVVTSERAWIMALPEVKLGKTVKVLEWKIYLANARGSFIGGR